jgi:hypothetical protein
MTPIEQACARLEAGSGKMGPAQQRTGELEPDLSGPLSLVPGRRIPLHRKAFYSPPVKRGTVVASLALALVNIGLLVYLGVIRPDLRDVLGLALAASVAVFTIAAASFSAMAAFAAYDAVRVAERAERNARLDRHDDQLRRVAQQVNVVEDAIIRVMGGQSQLLFSYAQSGLKAALFAAPADLKACEALAASLRAQEAADVVGAARDEVADAIRLVAEEREANLT